MSDENKNLNNGFTDKLLSDITQKAEQENLLKLALSIQAELKERASQNIVFPPPILMMGEHRLMEQNTINSLQGAKGSHKSRIVETICALLLHPNPNPQDFIGFSKQENTLFDVVYIDTERSTQHLLPYSMQKIQVKASFRADEDLPNFHYLSLVKVPRKQRFDLLQLFLQNIRSNTDNPIFVVLDVITDCVDSFNNIESTNKLLDFLNVLINDNDITFLNVIHENPGSVKARGHLGSESGNKASGEFRIGFEKDGNKNDTEVLQLKILKLRMGKRPEPIYLQYDDASKGLIIAEQEAKAKVKRSRFKVARIPELIDFLKTIEQLRTEWVEAPSLSKLLVEHFKVSKKTADSRIKILCNEDINICINTTNYNLIEQHKENLKDGKANLVKLTIASKNKSFSI